MRWHERDPATQLPIPLTPFIGRARESATAIELLRDEDVRLLTLTGPSGAGKSRLALHIALELDEEMPDGVVFVPLSTVTEADRVLPTIANSHGIRDANGQSAAQSLNSVLANQRKLLVLDNFEQVVDAAPELAGLLTTCSGLKILVTSQVPLHIQGEQELPVPPLDVPPANIGTTWKVPPLDEIAGYDAIALFVQRARSAQPGFALTTDNALAIVEICRRLDGLPLAIELAAARIKLLSPSALLSRLATRLGILTSGARDLPPRLQTMRAAIGWSYDLLNAEEQLLFRRLAVFSGGFTLEAAEEVADQGDLNIEIFDGVASLVDKSLLRPADSPTDEPRFMMLETIREYGNEQLELHDEADYIRSHHAGWFAELAAQASEELIGREATGWLDKLEAEHDNIRAVLAWFLDNDETGGALAMATDLWFFWFQRSYYSEGRSWLERSLAQGPHEPSATLATALSFAGVFAQPAGDFDAAFKRLDEGREVALAIGDKEEQAKATLGLADVYENTGNYERATSLYEEAVSLFRETGSMNWLAMALTYLGVVIHLNGDDVRSEQLINEGLEICNNTGFAWGSAMALSKSGRIATNSGDFALATQRLQQCINLWHTLGDRWRVSRGLVDLADVAAHMNDPKHALRLLAAAQGLNERLGETYQFIDDVARKRAIEMIRSQLDQAEFEGVWQAGWSLTWDEALAEAKKPIQVQYGAASLTPVANETGHNLTAREIEVLQLLASGHSDRQIAEELFISPRTAQSHVGHIFTKLGVNSRTAATTAAIRAGIIMDVTPPMG